MEILSPSKISLLSSCTWAYYCRYLLKLPNQQSLPMSKGTTVHTLLELLIVEKRKDYVEKIVKDKAVNIKSINRLIKKLCRKYKIDESEIPHIHQLLVTGLSFDFHCHGSDKILPEERFVLETPKYIIRGVIDKIAVSKDGTHYKIYDYKTSKSKFSGYDVEFNIQALTYALYIYKTYGVVPEVDFVFVNFKKKPIQKFVFTEKELLGFESYLSYISTYVDNFNMTHAVSNFAKDTDKGFMMCGKCFGDKKVDGNAASICDYKYPRIYFAAKDAEGKVIRMEKSKKDLDNLKMLGYSIEQFEYSGCPRFQHLWN